MLDPSLSSLLNVVQKVEPVIGAHSANAERERRPPDTVADAIREAGLYRLWCPKDFGGLEVDPMTASRVPDAAFAGSFFPFRRGVAVDGGYRVSGQAKWFMGLVHIYDGDTQRLNGDGSPVTIMTMCPVGEATILDTWHTMGMRGTGSHDVVMNDALVPSRHTALLAPYDHNPGASTGARYTSSRCGQRYVSS